jgi:membrane associated rhomboid family serine protease
MFPLGDASRRLRHFPIITIALIVINFGVFLLELIHGNAFILRFAMVPAQVTSGHAWITVLTAMFMHVGWAHILGNMLFFWVFGPEIEDVMGPFRFLIFYLLSGLIATSAQIIINPTSTVPNLGASGAIAGVMGAFMITYPRDRIRTIIFFGFFIQLALIPAAILVGVWFLLQLFSQIGSFASLQAGGIAYMAHIGGFLFGLLAGRLFETSRRRQMQGLES